VDARLKEHQRHICLEHPDKSAMAEHSVDLGHRIQFHNTSALATKTQYMDRIVREAIEMELHRNSMNREVCFCLSKLWKPLIFSLKKPDKGSTRSRRSVYARQSSPEAVGSIPTCRPFLFPLLRLAPIPALACYLLAHLYDVSPPLSLLISMWPTLPPFLSLYSWLSSTGAQSAATSRWLLACGFSTLKMEAIRSSETSVRTRTTRRHVPENGILQSFIVFLCGIYVTANRLY
jgi:hypothetical protein